MLHLAVHYLSPNCFIGIIYFVDLTESAFSIASQVSSSVDTPVATKHVGIGASIPLHPIFVTTEITAHPTTVRTALFFTSRFITGALLFVRGSPFLLHLFQEFRSMKMAIELRQANLCRWGSETRDIRRVKPRTTWVCLPVHTPSSCNPVAAPSLLIATCLMGADGCWLCTKPLRTRPRRLRSARARQLHLPRTASSPMRRSTATTRNVSSR